MKWIIFIIGITAHLGQGLAQVSGRTYDDSYRLDPEISKADSLIYQEEFRDAEKILLHRLKELGEPDIEPKLYILNQLTYVSRRLRKYDAADGYLTQVNQIQALHGDQYPLERIRSLGYQADLLFFTDRAENADTALVILQNAAQIADSILSEVHIDRIFGAVLNGRICYELNQNQESIGYYNTALQLQKAIYPFPHPEIAYSYRQLGINYRAIDDYERAESYHLEAVRIFESLKQAPAAKMSYTYSSLASVYFVQNYFKKAIPYYQRAVDVAIKNGLPESIIATPIANLGTSFTEVDSLSQARKYFMEALRINTRSGNATRTANAYEQLGEFYQQIGELDSAEFCFRRAFEFQPSSAIVQVSNLYTSLARVAMAKKEVERGLQLIQNAIVSLNLFHDETVEFSVDQVVHVQEARLIELFKVIQVKADLFLLAFHKDQNQEMLYKAIENYEILDNLSDQIRNGAYGDASKLFLSQSLKSGAENSIRCYAELHKLAPDWMQLSRVFDLMEKNRYARMAIQLEQIQQSESSRVPDSLIQQQKLFTSEIEGLRQELADNPEDKERQRILFQKTETYRYFRQGLADDYPSYFQIDFDSMLDLAQLQQWLTPDQQLLEYFWGDSIVAILSITREDCRFDLQPRTRQLETNLEKLFNWILSDSVSSQSPNTERYGQFADLSHAVYQVLLGNLRDPSKSDLVISPDGLLSQIPFEVLVTSGEGRDFRTAPYLLREVNIQYAFSSDLQVRQENSEPVSRPSVLAFAYSDRHSSRSAQRRNQLMEIPESGLEVNRIKKILGRTGSNYFTGAEATKSNFKKHLNHQDIIHLALHGVGDIESELNSHLIFRSEDSAEDDGRLFAHELYTLDLSQVRMAVLSACETGIGREYPGEGVFSMARGFARSGCSGIVMSLWQAVDAKTAEIMDFFYRNLKAGMGSAEALRQAKLKYLDETPYSMDTPPYYWAAFVHMGDANPVVKSKGIPLILWMVPIFFGVLLTYFILKRVKIPASGSDSPLNS